MYFYHMGGVVSICYISCIVVCGSFELGRGALNLGFGVEGVLYMRCVVYSCGGFVSFRLEYLVYLGILGM